MSIFKLLFGRPQMMIIQSISPDKEALDKSSIAESKKQLLRRLSSVYNQENSDEEVKKEEHILELLSADMKKSENN